MRKAALTSIVGVLLFAAVYLVAVRTGTGQRFEDDVWLGAGQTAAQRPIQAVRALHSISEPEEALDLVADALVEWRHWLEDLAERFERYPLAGLSDPDAVTLWERGAVHLIHHVVERTEAGDAWYRHCAQVLTWFLNRWGVTEERAGRLVTEAIGGRFGSWIGPGETLIDTIAGQLSRSLAEASPEPNDG